MPAEPARSESVVVFRADPVLPEEARARRRTELIDYLRTHEASCATCGYNLHGLNGVQCPECGWVFDLTLLKRQLEDAVRPRRLPWSPRWLTMGTACAFAVTLSAVAAADRSAGQAVGALLAAASAALSVRWFGPWAAPCLAWRRHAVRLIIAWLLIIGAGAHRVLFS